jgi:hypothetical protein
VGSIEMFFSTNVNHLLEIRCKVRQKKRYRKLT